MRGTFTGWFGFILILVSVLLSVMLIVDGTPWVDAVHKNASNMAMGVAFIAWSAAERAEALAKRGKDRVP